MNPGGGKAEKYAYKDQRARNGKHTENLPSGHCLPTDEKLSLILSAIKEKKQHPGCHQKRQRKKKKKRERERRGEGKSVISTPIKKKKKKTEKGTRLTSRGEGANNVY